MLNRAAYAHFATARLRTLTHKHGTQANASKRERTRYRRPRDFLRDFAPRYREDFALAENPLTSSVSLENRRPRGFLQDLARRYRADLALAEKLLTSSETLNYRRPRGFLQDLARRYRADLALAEKLLTSSAYADRNGYASAKMLLRKTCNYTYAVLTFKF